MNQCLQLFNNDKFVFVVKIIISLSSYKTNSSPRSVFLKLSGKRVFESEHGVERCRRIVLVKELGDGELPTALKAFESKA